MPFEVKHQVELEADKIYKAKLVDLEVRTIRPKDPSKDSFEMLKWKFEIIDTGELGGVKVQGECSAFLSDHPDNTFRNWSEALLGRPLPQGVQLDEQDLIGLQALITIRFEPDRNDPKKKWRRVDEVMPVFDSPGSDAPF